MKKLMRCPECGHRRKRHHEQTAGTKESYSPSCKRLGSPVDPGLPTLLHRPKHPHAPFKLGVRFPMIAQSFFNKIAGKL